MDNCKKTDVLIIGAGILGCMAARQLAKYDLDITVLEKNNDVGRGITRANTAIIYPGYDQHPGSLKAELTVKANRNFEQLCKDLGVPYKKCGSMMIGFGPNAEKTIKKKYEHGLENGVDGIKLLNHDEIMALEPNIIDKTNLQKIRSVSTHPEVLVVSEELLASDEMHENAKNLNEPAIALYSETAGTVNPWQLCIAAFENAKDNGVRFVFNSEVVDIKHIKNNMSHEDSNCTVQTNMIGSDKKISECKNFLVKTKKENYETKAVLITAGLNAAKIWEMVEKPQVRINPMAADYLVLDTDTEGIVNHIIQIEPEEKGEGLTMVPTVDGNMLIGPTRREYKCIGTDTDVDTNIYTNIYTNIDPGKDTFDLHSQKRTSGQESDAFDTSFPTEHNGIQSLVEKMHNLVPQFSFDDVIRYFGTMRPNPYYVIETEKGYEKSEKSINDFKILEKDGLFNLIGIKTPGITCSNELGKYISKKIVVYLEKIMEKKEKNENEDTFAEMKEIDDTTITFTETNDVNVTTECTILEKINSNDNNMVHKDNNSSNSNNSDYRKIKIKSTYNPCRKGIRAFRDLLPAEANELIKNNPMYGNIICKCGKVSEAEIVEAIRRGATDMEGIKRRVNTRMGRCQGSSCDEEVAKILARETGENLSEII